MATRRVDLEGAAHLVLPDGLAHLRPEEAVFEAMLAGWTRQQTSRQLSITTIERPAGWPAALRDWHSWNC